MEVVSATASILGVVSVALQVIKALNNDIDDIKNVPSLIKNTKTDLDAIAPVLQKLKDASSSNGQQLRRFDIVMPAVQNCSRACDEFRNQLASWSKRSNDPNHGQTTRMFSVKVGLFGQKRIELFKTQVSSCKEILTLALMQTTSMYHTSLYTRLPAMSFDSQLS